MAARPVLVLQLRRMGDLVLTFPLLLEIHRRFPQSPVWLMGRQAFFEPLRPFAPGAVFWRPEQMGALAGQSYEAVINLGGGADAAALAARARADLKLGQLLWGDHLHVEGFWQLYRESLTQNNRHNVFHWADLFRLDLAPLPLPAIARPQPEPAGSGRMGLFVGASEEAKRPDAAFWAALSIRLASLGFKPVLLGGPAERELGRAIIAQGGRAADFCGQTSLNQLAAIIRGLDLLITPDTGPMHLADWLGMPVLNLSMGPVNARETGPHSPGGHVLRAALSCAGCWQCGQGRLRCRQKFMAPAVAKIAAAIAKGEEPPKAPGLELLTAGRCDLRLHSLAGGRQNAATALDTFWQAAFLAFRHNAMQPRLLAAARPLAEQYPALGAAMRQSLARMLASLARRARKGGPIAETFWLRQPAHSRLLAGYLHMFLQNSGFSRQAMTGAMDMAGMTAAALNS